jgi:hypothetical protein
VPQAFHSSVGTSGHPRRCVADVAFDGAFQELLKSVEGQKAMREDGLKVETVRMLVELTPLRPHWIG